MNTINPIWTAYNNLHNEGGEGYNPHPQHIEIGGGEPLWSKLSDRAYRLQNLCNGMSDTDPSYAAKRAEVLVLRAAAADALARKI